MERVILAVDTSHRLRRIAVLADRSGRVVAGGGIEGSSSAGAVAAELGALLATARGRVEALVVAVGPGSHIGVRAGMAAALGMAQALDLPLHGVGSLEVVAHGGHAAAGWAVADAGRGFLHVARFTMTGARPRVEAPRRHRLDRWRPEGSLETVVSFDRLPIARLHVVGDPAAALAMAAVAALSRPPLQRDGLSAELAIAD